MKYFSRKYKSIQLHAKHPLLGGAIIATFVVIMLVATPSWATASENRNPALGDNEASQPQPKLNQVKVTITKKSLQHIFTIGRNYAVNKETLIVGKDGKEVKLKKMLVPCDVVVSYRMENGARTAKRIDIKRVSSGASWQWVAEQPE